MSKTDRRQRLAAALVCVAIGGFLVYAIMAGLPGWRTPPAIGMLAAVVFVAAGMALGLQSLGYTRAAVLPIVLLLTAMTGIGGWIGFGPGGRECRGSLNARRFVVGEGACRMVFGGGALLTGSIVLLALRSMGKGRSSSSDRAV